MFLRIRAATLCFGAAAFGLGFGGNAQSAAANTSNPAKSGVPGTGYGAGGSSGVATQNQGAQNRANGTDGVCIVTEYQ